MPTQNSDNSTLFVARVLAQSQQLVIVTTRDWQSITGKLQCYERINKKSRWGPSNSSFKIVVGLKGLGWGLGLHPKQAMGDQNTNNKQESDGKAPAGVFKLSSAFGYAPIDQARWVKLPYTSLTSGIECIDDVKSKSYNLIADRDLVEDVDWNSSEKMLRKDRLYRWGIVIDHNMNPPKSGVGSCIFLHIWRREGEGTAGCTAMAERHLKELLRWLDPKKNPILVQLPMHEYNRRQNDWQLPWQITSEQ